MTTHYTWQPYKDYPDFLIAVTVNNENYTFASGHPDVSVNCQTHQKASRGHPAGRKNICMTYRPGASQTKRTAVLMGITKSVNYGAMVYYASRDEYLPEKQHAIHFIDGNPINYAPSNLMLKSSVSAARKERVKSTLQMTDYWNAFANELRIMTCDKKDIEPTVQFLKEQISDVPDWLWRGAIEVVNTGKDGA